MKKAMAILCLLLAVAAGVGYFVYDRLTYRPGWYEAGDAAAQPADIGALVKLGDTIRQQLADGKKARIPADQLIPLAMAQIEAKSGFPLSKTLKGHRVTVTRDGIEAEMIVDFTQLPTERLPGDFRKLVDGMVGRLPDGALRNLYVRSRLKPVMKNGTLNLDPASGLSIGKMEVPLNKLEKALGKSARVPLDRFPVGDFKLTDQFLHLLPKADRG